MTNVTLIKKSSFEGFYMIQNLLEEKGEQNLLLITDSADSEKYWESKNVRVELVRSIDDSVMRYLYPRYKNVDTIIVSSPRLIHRYYNETVNVKVNKAKEFFVGFNSNIYILSDYTNAASIVSNSQVTEHLSNKKVVAKLKK